ncbi:pentapeptide repeat-containing protein [Kamptonema sp. UHCC 0994]|uniref:pentapeptide repeat-containing protein n=1 Tax=Kamptonema sp. UHCC 0994 TaxID=3031329 RepID=UPI0023B9FDD1|nr:pentapeptide repeat-containing protein [Kamptonema sp. UHCC 0994]MDF0554998.1 pentapeptide repeat-containing protein [Kamptonema sp. UHCC 0994]
MTVDEALTIAETALNYDRLNKIQEIVFRQSWEGRSYKEIAASTEYEYDYIKDAGAKLWKLLSKALEEKVKKDNLKSVLKRYLRRNQVNVQRNLTIEVNLSGANLSGANLSGARLFANLNEADYGQADLDKTITADSETGSSNSENEIEWNGFHFDSDAQVKIAEILDRTSTLFIPNSQLRLTTPAGRQNQKAQFLVFHQGKLGILEVDGDRAPEDEKQDGQLDIVSLDSGICLVKHYDASLCSEQPDLVVQEFLAILSQE